MTRALYTGAMALSCSVAPVQADPITYNLASTVSGTLGASSFTNALVTVTLTGPRADRRLLPSLEPPQST